MSGSRRPTAPRDGITVLMPCRNPHYGFFAEALSSVQRQTSPRWSLLVVTLPEEEERIRGFVGEVVGDDARVEILAREHPSLPGALNIGMRKARTDFVTVLFVDDLLAPETIEVLGRSIAEHPEVDFFHSARRFIDEKGRSISSVYPAVPRVELEKFKRSSQVKHLMCYRRELALSIGGIDEGLGPHGADDYDFPWCLAEAGCTFRGVPECLYIIRDHRAHFRLTTHVPLEVQRNELRKILRKHGVAEAEIEANLSRRTYLRQALYQDDADREEKERSGFDPNEGWRQSYGESSAGKDPATVYQPTSGSSEDTCSRNSHRLRKPGS